MDESYLETIDMVFVRNVYDNVDLYAGKGTDGVKYQVYIENVPNGKKLHKIGIGPTQ